MTHSGRIYTLDKLMVKQKRDGEKGKERVDLKVVDNEKANK